MEGCDLTQPFGLVTSSVMNRYIVQVRAHSFDDLIERHDIRWRFLMAEAGGIRTPADKPVRDRRRSFALGSAASFFQEEQEGNVMG